MEGFVEPGTKAEVVMFCGHTVRYSVSIRTSNAEWSRELRTLTGVRCPDCTGVAIMGVWTIQPDAAVVPLFQKEAVQREWAEAEREYNRRHAG